MHPGGIRTGLQAATKWDVGDWLVVIKSGPMATLMTMMNAEQGASTSVWAAVSRDLEGQGGKYLERNRFSEPLKKGWKMIDPGHAEWAYDGEAAARLYDLSLKEVGL